VKKLIALLPLLLCLLSACSTTPRLPPADFSQPGWKVRQAQAVWTPKRGGPEIAGEVIIASQGDKRAFVQFSKTPFPILVAQTAPERWEMTFIPEQRTFSGGGRPWPRFSWLYLAPALRGETLPDKLIFHAVGNEGWRLENRSTGEVIEGFFLP